MKFTSTIVLLASKKGPWRAFSDDIEDRERSERAGQSQECLGLLIGRIGYRRAIAVVGMV